MVPNMFGVWYDVVWSVAAVAAILLLGAALKQWFRSGQGGLLGLLQVAVIVLLPILGPAAYLAATASTRARPGQRDRRPVGASA